MQNYMEGVMIRGSLPVAQLCWESVSVPQQCDLRLRRLGPPPRKDLGSRTQVLPFSRGRWFTPWLGTVAVQPLPPASGQGTHDIVNSNSIKGTLSPEQGLAMKSSELKEKQ